MIYLNGLAAREHRLEGIQVPVNIECRIFAETPLPIPLAGPLTSESAGVRHSLFSGRVLCVALRPHLGTESKQRLQARFPSHPPDIYPKRTNRPASQPGWESNGPRAFAMARRKISRSVLRLTTGPHEFEWTPIPPGELRTKVGSCVSLIGRSKKSRQIRMTGFMRARPVMRTGNEGDMMTATINWISLVDTVPPDGLVVLTKIDDAYGARNETKLVRKGALWFFPDFSMYVYYTPTHWAEIAKETAQ